MKTGARDNSAAFRSRPAEISPASRSGRGGLIGGRSRRSGRSSGGRARSAKTRTRDARDARGDTRDRTRRRERGRAEMVFGEGRGRSRARGRGTGPRARPVRHPPPPAQKSTSPCQRVGRVRKNDVRSVRRTGRPSRCDRARAGSGGYSRDTPLTRPRTRVSRSTRAVCRARRAISVDPAVKRSRRICGAFSRRNPRLRRAVSAPASERLASPFASPRPRWTTPRLSPRHARPRFPTLPSGRRDAVRCAGATRANTVNRTVLSSGSFTENPDARPPDAVNGVFLK